MESDQTALPDSDPIALFGEWFAEARASEPNDPDAVALATATPDGGMPTSDGGGMTDAGVDDGGGADAGRRRSGGGGGCSAAGSTGGAWFALLFVRRRRIS